MEEETDKCKIKQSRRSTKRIMKSGGFVQDKSSASSMKSPPTIADDGDDIFGPPRTYATGYCPPKNRPSMISAKYRQKEERRKVLKISINKLKKIEDPEASLCRSVLINNTVKKLQKEARDEKIQKQQLNYPRCYDNDNFLNIKSEFIKNEMKTYDEPKSIGGGDFDVFDGKISDESAKSALGLMDEGAQDEKKRSSYDDIEDCDVQDVLSQFYMPPTPRMLTSIDDDEDVNVVDDEPVAKKQKLDVVVDERVNQFINNNITESESRIRYLGQTMEDTNTFTCGQASMFSELQNNVFHSLMASLET